MCNDIDFFQSQTPIPLLCNHFGKSKGTTENSVKTAGGLQKGLKKLYLPNGQCKCWTTIVKLRPTEQGLWKEKGGESEEPPGEVKAEQERLRSMTVMSGLSPHGKI